MSSTCFQSHAPPTPHRNENNTVENFTVKPASVCERERKRERERESVCVCLRESVCVRDVKWRGYVAAAAVDS